jgi:hypothetical protein
VTEGEVVLRAEGFHEPEVDGVVEVVEHIEFAPLNPESSRVGPRMRGGGRGGGVGRGRGRRGGGR